MADKPTIVRDFGLDRDTLTIKLSRPTDRYNYDKVADEPKLTDIPPDFLEALKNWVNNGLR